MGVDFIKYNSLRKKKFELKTLISTENEVKTIKKIPMSSESSWLTKKIYDNHFALQEFYKNHVICPVSIDDDILTFDYIEGKSLKELLIEKLKINDKKGAVDLLYEYKSIVLDNNRIIPEKTMDITDEFVEIFGEYEGTLPFEYIKLSNIDFSFDNTIINDSKYYIIDYEWIFDFPVPLNFIIYRNLLFLYMSLNNIITDKNFISFNSILHIFDIDDSEILLFEKMESSFSYYVHENKVNTITNYLKPIHELNELEKNYIFSSKKQHFAQIFWNSNDGISEKNSISVEYSLTKEKSNIIKFTFDNLSTNMLRFDPLSEHGVIYLDHLSVVYSDNTSEELTPTSNNAILDIDNEFFFATIDPQIYFNVDNTKNIIELSCEFKYSPLLDTIETLNSKILEYKFLLNEKYDLLASQYNELNVQNNELNIQNNELNIQNNELNNKNNNFINQINEYNNSIETLKTNLSKTNEDYNNALLQIQDLKNNYNNILKSSSWKITKPIRSIKKLFIKQ